MDINNLKPINNIPLTEKVELGYRTITNSSSQNLLQSNVINDILDLFNKANNIEKSIEQSKDIINTENKYLQLKLARLSNELTVTKELYNNLSTSSNIKTISIYPNQCTVDSEEFSACIDIENNDITMGISSTNSKVNFFDEVFHTTFIPPSLITELYPLGDDINVIDNNVSNMFIGDPNAFWTRKIITDNSINEVTTQLVVILPDDIVSSRDINTIIINPYPSESTDIINVEYSLYGSWTPIKAFNNHFNASPEVSYDAFGNLHQTKVLLDSPSIKLNFKDISANMIRITFRQRKYLNGENNTRVFYLGAKSINILNTKYNKGYSTFQSIFDFPEVQGTIVFNGIKVILNNDSELKGNEVQTEFYYMDSNNFPHKITDTIPFIVNSKTLCIRYKLYQGETTPNINKIILSYNVI